MILTRRVLTALATVLATTWAALVLSAAPAAAGIPGLARGNVVFSDILNTSGVPIGVRSCGSGSVDDGPYLGGQFVYELVGVRSDGTQASDPQTPYPGPSFSHCSYIYFNGTTYGEFTVVVTYSGIGLDVTTLAYGEVAWSPETNGSTWLSSGT